MENIDANLKRWMECIQSLRLEEVIEEIQGISHITVSEKANKYIFKIVLYLSHTAHKCDKTICATGRNIYFLADKFCSMLINIPDSNRYVSSLYHILDCLLNMSLYEEASRLSGHLNSEHLSYSDPYVNDVMQKIAHLWSTAMSAVFRTFTQNPQRIITSKELRSVMKYELDIIRLIHKKNYMKYLLARVSQYLDTLVPIYKKVNSSLTEMHQFIIEYIKEQQDMVLNVNEKFMICRHVLHILAKIMHESINEKGIGSVRKSVKDILNYFKSILQDDDECHQCLRIFDSICLCLLRPVEELTPDIIEELHKNVKNYTKATKKYGFNSALKWAAHSIAEVLEPLLLYWEASIKEKKQACLSNNVLQGVMNLTMHVTISFIEQTWDKCKSCQSEDCLMRKDVYNAVVLRSRCINFICKLTSNDVTKETCVIAREILEDNVSFIYEMKNSRCKTWCSLWSTCSVLIYNLGILCEKVYEESATLFSLLCTCLIKFEGVKQKYKYINLQNPISATLHRLSSVHYNNGMYREAMTASALNGLLSYGDPNSKAFRMWANIKYKSLSSNKLLELTMLACLKADKSEIEELGLNVDLSKYNLVQLCIREARGLQDAKVNVSVAIEKVFDELYVLDATALERAIVVQILEYHLMNFKRETDTSERLKNAISDLAKTKNKSASVACTEANLEFYIFVNELQAVNQKTYLEMENTKFPLYAAELEDESRDVVPAYTMINIKEDSRLMSSIRRPLKRWTDSFDSDIIDIVNGWEPLLTLQILIVAAEYSRLYRYESCEKRAWTLAYKLANELQDYRAVIYVTGRTISLRQINREWITVAKDLSNRLQDSTDADIIEAIAIFWISLADYYFEYGMQDEAKILLNDARSLPGISFLANTAVYLYYLDRLLWNCHAYNRDLEHEQFTQYIVETLYAMLTLSDGLNSNKWKVPAKYLFSYDILFSTVVNLSLRMNSLLSFREITGHLVRRLKTAQALGATIRVAELLKSLCYIDLSRSQLADCEVKLQGLEHILNTEAIESSMHTNKLNTQTEYNITTPTRSENPWQSLDNAASPVLRKKVFDKPVFLCHKNCKCYCCRNVSYHYLVFAATHIRAQLYGLQKVLSPALEHFQGAFLICKDLMTSRNTMQLHPIEFRDSDSSTWQQRFYILDYILLLMNFGCFLQANKRNREQQVLDVLQPAINICKKYKLKGHPIYKSLRELILNNHFQKVFTSDDFSSFTVPSQSSIDISKYIKESKAAETICTTPTTNNTCRRKPLSIRRNKTPPLLKLTKVNIIYSDDEDNNLSPTHVQKKRTRPQRLTRRKILEDDYIDTTSTTKLESSSSENKVSGKKSSLRKTNSESTLLKDIVNRVPPITPESSREMCELSNSSETSVKVENVEEITEKVRNLRVSARTQTKVNTRIPRKSKQSVANDSDNKINETIKLFNNIAIKEESDNPKSPETANSSNVSIVEGTPPQLSRARRRILQKQQPNAEENSSKTGKFSRAIVPFNENESDNKAVRTSETKAMRTKSTRQETSKKETQSLRSSRRLHEKSL